MIERIFGYRTKSTEPPVDCFECRMVGGTGLTGLGTYIMYYAFKRRHSTNSRATIFVSSFLGSIIFTLGLLRLTGLNAPMQPLVQATPSANLENNNETLKD